MADLTPDLQVRLSWGLIAESFHSLQSLSVSCFHVILGLPGPHFPSTCMSKAVFIAPLEHSTCPYHRSLLSFRMRPRSSMPSRTSRSLDLVVTMSCGLTLQYHCWITRGMCQEALDLERSDGGERTESKCRKDHDLWYGPGPPAELRRVSVCCLSHWSGQQQHLLQWLQALGAQEISGLKRLTNDPDYRCTRCQGTAHPLDGRPQREVQVGPDKLEVVASFCYLADMLSAARSCYAFSSCHLFFKICGRVYSSCVWSTMLHASEIDGKHRPGRPKMTWKQLTERDCRMEALSYRP